ncbi:hypothetical protein EV401DRAFT_1893017 [Pisolithus croceorrhizus]|nr:hypothetical protein EV401DRAFT_1893017 [Pisolithus croceorrhizus]
MGIDQGGVGVTDRPASAMLEIEWMNVDGHEKGIDLEKRMRKGIGTSVVRLSEVDYQVNVAKTRSTSGYKLQRGLRLLHNTPPLDQIELHIIRMWKARRTDMEILQEVQKHIDTNQYGIGLTKLRAIRKDLGLYGTCQQGHTPESIRDAMVELRQMYPNADVVEELGHIPLVTQSDPGTENFGIANAQSMLRQWHDPELVSTLQHRWMWHKKNITPEIMWSQLRHRFTPGFEAILEHGVKEGWYDIENTLERLVFCWLFIPWLQEELLGYRDCVNNTAKRRDCNKILPHGIPNLIYESAGDYGALDFRVKVDPAAIEHVRKLYIKPTHTVFDLVPPAFGAFIEEFYVHMGRPSVTRQNVWTIYRGLCNMIRQHADALTVLKSPSLAPTSDNYDDDEFPLYEGRDLLFNETEGNYYMGGLRGGLGLAVPGNEHLRQLNELENDEPVIDDDGPVLILPAFSDDEEQNECIGTKCESAKWRTYDVRNDEVQKYNTLIGGPRGPQMHLRRGQHPSGAPHLLFTGDNELDVPGPQFRGSAVIAREDVELLQLDA